MAIGPLSTIGSPMATRLSRCSVVEGISATVSYPEPRNHEALKVKQQVLAQGPLDFVAVEHFPAPIRSLLCANSRNSTVTA